MQWQFVSKWQILHLLDVQKHKSSYEFVMGWRTPFYIVGHFALLNWHIRACWKDVCLCPLEFFTPTLCCRLASVYSWTSKSRAPCANISGRLLRLTSYSIIERHYGEEASLQIARWWDWGLLWLERKCSPLCEMTCAQQKLQHKQLQISQIWKENQVSSPAPLHNKRMGWPRTPACGFCLGQTHQTLGQIVFWWCASKACLSSSTISHLISCRETNWKVTEV